MGDEEKGAKWWIRYVVVPLIGGGGIIAVVVALIPQHPSSNSPIINVVTPGTATTSPESDKPKPPSSTGLIPSTKSPQRGSSIPAIHHLGEVTGVDKSEYVTIQHSRDLSSEFFLIDGQKPADGVIVDSTAGAPITTLRLTPGQHRLSANLEDKKCSITFSVPANGPVPFPCEVPFEGSRR